MATYGEEETRIRRMLTYGDIWGRGKKNKTHGDIWGLWGYFGKRMENGDIWGMKMKDWGQMTCRSISHVDCKTQCTLRLDITARITA